MQSNNVLSRLANSFANFSFSFGFTLRKKRLLNLSGFSHLEFRLNGVKNMWLTVSLQTNKPPWKRHRTTKNNWTKPNCFPGGLLNQLENWREIWIHVFGFWVFSAATAKVKAERTLLSDHLTHSSIPVFAFATIASTLLSAAAQALLTLKVDCYGFRTNKTA